MPPDQDRIYYLLSDNPGTAAASPHLEAFRKRGLEVLLLTDRIDPWVTEGLAEYDGKALADVAREGLELPEGDGSMTQGRPSASRRLSPTGGFFSVTSEICSCIASS